MTDNLILMPNENETFFPARANRPDWEFVLHEFPFPLAITCARLHLEMDRQEPVAAAWALRDAFECLLKFTAALAVADFLNARPDPLIAGELAELLLKPSGLSLGDWHSLLEMALEPLKPLALTGEWSAAGRILPGLYPIFFETTGQLRRTSLNRRIDGSPDSFVAWRNRVFGHGVFSQDRGYYAQETLFWLPILHEFYTALRPVLAGRRLVSRTPGGEEVVWQGAGELPSVPRHEHEPWGDPLPMFLRPAPGLDLPALPLTPFLSMQECRSCGQPAAFFFDKNKYDRKQDRHSTAFLEYFSGHPGTQKNWLETRRLADLLPPTFVWERGSYDGDDADGTQDIVFRDFGEEYLRPGYLLDAVWRITNEQPKGYIHLVGPGGMGKSYFVRGLSAEGAEQGAAVLPYHILPGTRTDYQTFLPEMNAHARDVLRFRTPEPQMDGKTPTAMQAELASYLSKLKQANRIDLLVVAIDALDELEDPAERSFGITDLLPPPDLLPDGCFFVLTSREQMRPKVRADIARLQAAAPDAYTTLALDTNNAANTHLLRAYLAQHLSASMQTPETVDAVLDRCGGIFLYAFHLCRALESGVFPGVSSLPDAAHFYPAYLERLRARVGGHLYETVYLPTLLLLCAARQPVTLGQLARWGVPHDRLQFALLDLRDFLRVHRELPWQDRLGEPDGESRFEMAHDAFVRFINEDRAMSHFLLTCHEQIALNALHTSNGMWHEMEFSEATALYDLRFVADHLRLSMGEELTQEMMTSGTFDSGNFHAGRLALEEERYFLAVDLLGRAEALASYKDESAFENPRRGRLRASAQLFKGRALAALGYLDEALACYDAAFPVLLELSNAEGLAREEKNLASQLFCTALIGLGFVYNKLGRFQEAMGCYTQAETLAQRWAVTHPDEFVDFDEASWGRAGCYINQKKPELALPLLEELATERRRKFSGVDLLSDEVLNGALSNMAVALMLLDRPTDALLRSEEVIFNYRKLLEAGHFEYRLELAHGLFSHGQILLAVDRKEDAIQCFEEVIATYLCLPEDRLNEVIGDFAEAKHFMGKALYLLRRLPEALDCLEDGIRMTRWQVNNEGKAHLMLGLSHQLARAGRWLSELDYSQKASDYLLESARLLHDIVSQNRPELIPDLISIITSHFDLCRRSQAWKAAADDSYGIVLITDPYFKRGNMSQVLAEALFNFVRSIKILNSSERALYLAELSKLDDEVRKQIQFWMED